MATFEQCRSFCHPMLAKQVPQMPPRHRGASTGLHYRRGAYRERRIGNGLQTRGSPAASLTAMQASGGQAQVPSPESPRLALGSALLGKQRADNKTTRRQLGVLREASTLNGWKHDPHFVGSGGASPSERDTTGECNVALVKIGMVVPMHILLIPAITLPNPLTLSLNQPHLTRP